jgi:hypothetical protein
MPNLDDFRFALNDQATNLVQFAWVEPMVPRECDGRQPKLRVLPIAPHMDVHGFVTVEAIEE